MVGDAPDAVATAASEAAAEAAVHQPRQRSLTLTDRGPRPTATAVGTPSSVSPPENTGTPTARRSPKPKPRKRQKPPRRQPSRPGKASSHAEVNSACRPTTMLTITTRTKRPSRSLRAASQRCSTSTTSTRSRASRCSKPSPPAANPPALRRPRTRPQPGRHTWHEFPQMPPPPFPCSRPMTRTRRP